MFECRVDGISPLWLINEREYSYNFHRERGIVATSQQISPTEHRSRLMVHATESNNNSELKCRALGNVESAAVFLKIQGM